MTLRKFKQCYLHIGATKTGTSSIQAACASNRALLEQNGFCYPVSGDNTHSALAARFRKNPEKMWMFTSTGMQNPAEVEAYIAKEMAKFEACLQETEAHTLVLSSEFFPSTQPEKCFELRDYLLQWAETVTVIYYVRHPVAQYSSALQQGIKQGMETLDDRRSYRFYAAGVSRKFQAAFGKENMRVREYNRSKLFKGDSVADFFRGIELPIEIASETASVSVNEGLSFEGVLLSDAFNRQFPVQKDGALNPERSRHVKFTGIPGKKFVDTPKSLAEIQERCADDIQYMRDEYGLELALPVSVDEASAGEAGAEWAQETLDVLVAKVNDLGLRLEAAETAKSKAEVENAQVSAPQADVSPTVERTSKSAWATGAVALSLTAVLALIMLPVGLWRDAGTVSMVLLSHFIMTWLLLTFFNRRQ